MAIQFPHGAKFALLVFLCCVATFSTAQPSVTTFHYDNARTGQNVSETSLTLSNVNSNQFGKLFSTTVDGYVYAQPLYLPNVTISGAKHNVLYVATEHESVYAIDADNGAVLWQQSFINPNAGITTVSSNDVACTDLVPEIGISSTPVIDPASGTIYLVTKTKENGSYVQRLHALDIATHAEKFGGPIVIAANSGGRTFNALMQHNRPGLLLVNGHVVIAWASHCDNTPYQGWIISYNAATLAQEAVLNTELNTGAGNDGGIWMSGDGVAADASGNLYFATGNGHYDGSADFGDSVMKLSSPSGGKFSILDWFTPFNQSSLSAGDQDLGAGGVLLLPNLPSGSAHQQLLVVMGKEGKIYLIDRNGMGKLCANCASSDTNIVQEIPGASEGIWGAPTFWNNTVYWGAGRDDGPAGSITAWSFNANNSGMLSDSPVSKTSQVFSFPTATPVVSANGNSNGILWILDNSSFGSSCCQVLYAYNASNLGTMLYNSNQAAGSRDVPGGAVKFSSPVVANGKVYVGSQKKVSAFGLLNSTSTASPPTFSPAPGSYANGVTVTLSDTTSGATIHCTTNGTTPSASSPVCNSVTITSTTLLQAIAVANGLNNSAVASGTYTIVSGGAIGEIGLKFVGQGTAMSSAEVAGVVAQANWNNASGMASTSSLPLLNQAGVATGAAATWTTNGIWSLPITDTAGNNRMMRGYLDTVGGVTTVTVAGLPSNSAGYDVYVYADGDNGTVSRSATYQISGPGVTTTSVQLTDAANTNFSGVFKAANNSAGNYVMFTIPGTQFTITATPGASTDSNPRAPVNAIQIVPIGTTTTADFSLTMTPNSKTVTPGASASYTATIAALNGFSGSVTLSASGSPSGATASFSPSPVNGSGSSTLTVTTSGTTPLGTSTITITAKSGNLTHTALVSLTVGSGGTTTGAIGVKFVGEGTAMVSTEVAGVVSQSNWNNASGKASSSPLPLLNQSGAVSGATVTWTTNGIWNLPITDTAGNNRLMRGYLDTVGGMTTVTVAGLQANGAGYNVYVYADGDNGTVSRSASYQISGPGVTTTSITLTDAANTNFAGVFKQASNSSGNYVMFTISGTQFTITATPGASTDTNPRAPLNAIQVVPK